LDNKKFSIFDSKKTLKRGENLQIDFLAKSSSQIPKLKRLKLNGHQICPNIDVGNADTACAKLEMIDEVKPGRWDGLLTILPKFPSSNVLQVAIEVDKSAWALGVSNDDENLVNIY
jgi:hypothetical protein